MSNSCFARVRPTGHFSCAALPLESSSHVRLAYFDYPNILVAGKAVSAARRGMAASPEAAAAANIVDHQFRLSLSAFRQFIIGPDDGAHVRAFLAGSQTAGSQSTVIRAAAPWWDGKAFDKSAAGKEKQVDTSISVEMIRDVMVLAKDPDHTDITLLSGDSDQLYAVETVKSLGYQVDVASWRHALSPRLAREARRVILLDDYFDLLTFRAMTA